MLNTKQRSIVFTLFCLFATVSVGVEVFLLYSLVVRDFTGIKVASAFLNGGVLVLFGRGFWALISKTFLTPSRMPPDRLHRYASQRCSIIENASGLGQDLYLIRRNLITNTLEFCEECLRGWVPGSHFELCVFVDQEQPLLFSYFDSNHDVTALSMKERERNPRFYVEKGYEVTKLLGAPTSYPRVVGDTLAGKAEYAFTSAVQRKQLRSSVLLCLEVATPCALVITSNEKNAFSETDPELMSFIRYIGASVRYDLFEGDFVRQIRNLKPKLFDVARAHQSSNPPPGQ
jgi:hypothetical protein